MHCNQPTWRLVVGTMLVLLLMSVTPTRAAVYIVDVTADLPDEQIGDGVCAVAGGGCSLRAAVQEANAGAGPDTIQITDLGAPYRLAYGPLIVSDNGTAIIGSASAPSIDGFSSPFESPSIVLRSDSNGVSGLTFRRARGHAVLIEGANNVIGGETTEQRITFVNNGLDNGSSAAVCLSGPTATDNTVLGCYIGVFGNGLDSDGNPLGVLIERGASENVIGSDAAGNIIAASGGYGVEVRDSDTHGNKIVGNLIGLLADETTLSGNMAGGIMITDGARKTEIIGNVIAGNDGDGVHIAGPMTSQTKLSGNLIGLARDGINPAGNAGAGVRIDNAATETVIGGESVDDRNVIAANRGDGVLISGADTRHNRIQGNFIGIDSTGRRSRSNGIDDGHGVTIADGARDNTIGGGLIPNTISGQLGFGIFITNADNNLVIGNFVGVNPSGQFAQPNGSGVVLRAGASANTIGGTETADRNIISGNYGDIYPFGCGVMLLDAGTRDNRVIGNFIGTDAVAGRAVQNREAGVMIGAGASYNTIGGSAPGEGNLISGNGFGTILPNLGRGIHVFGDGTNYNTLAGNVIGASPDGANQLANNGHAIAVLAGAEHTTIGGDVASAGNAIKFNRFHGLYIANPATRFTTIRHNSIIDNDSLPLVIADSANEQIVPPDLLAATLTTAEGDSAPSGGQVDIYRLTLTEQELVGSGDADQFGSFMVALENVQFGDSLSAIATDHRGNSSEFAEPITVSSVTDVEDDLEQLPGEFHLAQNYPNPFNPTTTIRYNLPSAAHATLEIYNSVGRLVRTLVGQRQPAGEHRVIWDGLDDSGSAVASGVYLYRLTTPDLSQSRKMLLLR
ncbi:T9SS type A sorting domain-containing protein [candidate division GN15 bacterium]|nr:T9SS type A sorting domain-containing protein [candidate division GN15 bacterium]